MQIDISKIPEAFEVRLGLPRPSWDAITTWVDANIAAKNFNIAWTEIARQWIATLQAQLGEEYEITESESFLVLVRRGQAGGDRLAYFCERSRRSICDMLVGVAQEEGYGKHVVLAFDSDETYYDYIADFYPEEGEFARSGGAFLGDGYGHFAFRYYDHGSAEQTIAHELTHSLLSHLPLSPWLNEGLTKIVEESVCGSSSFYVDRELAQRHREYWSAKSIHGFWSGDSFHAPDDGQELSYNLAQVLVRNLLADHRRKFLEFVCAASFADAGESAAREIFGVTLKDRVAQFLGPGDWMPRTDYGQEDPRDAASERSISDE